MSNERISNEACALHGLLRCTCPSRRDGHDWEKAEQKLIDIGASFDAMIARERADERRMIVSWLRGVALQKQDEADRSRRDPKQQRGGEIQWDVGLVVGRLADIIESGEHEVEK